MTSKIKVYGSWAMLIGFLFSSLAVCYSIGWIDPYLETTLVQIGINIILAVGLNLIIGFSGQFSLGHAGFMAIGAYATAIITLKQPHFGGFILGLLVGIIIAGLVALIVGIPTLRLTGDYLAIATLGISEIIRVLMINLDQVTNGAAGLFGIPPFVTWSMVFVAVCVTTLIVSNYLRSGAGRATLAIRENEMAAESMGINTTKYKVIAFVLGAMTAALAGGLHASYIQTILPKDFGFMKSIDILIIVVFGGVGSLTGTFVAAMILGLINMLLQNMSDLRMILYALALIIIMLFKPSGLLGSWEFSIQRLWQRKAVEKEVQS